ncbi:MAG: hypothetical protein LBT46_03315 [Planctomycetaceae bacterium]|jgi:hypothetical protein|nr:hypothetical protein [Planctomycetaceae bacterium]
MRIAVTSFVLSAAFILLPAVAFAEPIDREALVKRHTVELDKISDTELLQAGNGEIAFGIDPTGLQTFHGNTMSHWGWNSVPCPVEGKHAALKLEEFDFHGRKLSYRSSAKGQEKLYGWMRENPHRICLGRLRFLIKQNDGKLIEAKDVTDIRQTLNLWTGIIESRYKIENVPVYVETCVEPQTGSLAVRVHSPLITAGRLHIELAFPYGHHGRTGADWDKPDAHQTTLTRSGSRADFLRELDSITYHTALTWSGQALLEQTAPHTFVLIPGKLADSFEFVTEYAPQKPEKLPAVDVAVQKSKDFWKNFWQSGGAVDLSASKDTRWKELERRIVLSQYLLAVNESGSLPPQESGLFNNGWYGKFHLEMHWWHGAHYSLWGRQALFNPSLNFYRDTLPKACELAKSQGFKGARWPKMVGPDAEDSPSGTGPFLIWQQPHPVFYAELEYRLSPTKETLEKWRDIVQESAEFMSDFAQWDEKTKQYVLGPPLATVPENSNYRTTFNPAFELSYWRTGLRLAQTWRERLGLPREKHWDDVLQKLSPLPQHEGVYLSQEGMLNTYTKMNWEHPSLIGPGGMIPGDGTDSFVVRQTVQKVWSEWKWDRCWGWDFPMTAMAAARNGESKIAVDALLHSSGRNAMNRAGLSTGGPFPYFPSNGGLLYAVALMAAGWDGAPKDVHAPGFPQDGSWTVKYEGLAVAP